MPLCLALCAVSLVLNSGPHACVASHLPTEPPSQSSKSELRKGDETHKDLSELSSGPVSLGWCFGLIGSGRQRNEVKGSRLRLLPASTISS